MPIYEFRCLSCDHHYEDLVSQRDKIEELTCPKCGAKQVQQLLSSFSTASSAKASGGSSCGSGSFS
jgi:putative FmdB family regulatory protein